MYIAEHFLMLLQQCLKMGIKNEVTLFLSHRIFVVFAPCQLYHISYFTIFGAVKIDQIAIRHVTFELICNLPNYDMSKEVQISEPPSLIFFYLLKCALQNKPLKPHY